MIKTCLPRQILPLFQEYEIEMFCPKTKKWIRKGKVGYKIGQSGIRKGKVQYISKK